MAGHRDQVGVYWSLFQGAFPGKTGIMTVEHFSNVVSTHTEEWKNDPEFSQYMTDLTSYSIEKLREDNNKLVTIVARHFISVTLA